MTYFFIISAFPTGNIGISDIFGFAQKIKNARHVPQIIDMNELHREFEIMIEMLDKIITISNTSGEIDFNCLYFLLSKPIILFLQWFQLFDHAIN